MSERNLISKLRIDSYFSRPTDLAAEMGRWPEYVGGREYSVDLQNESTGELVSVRFVEGSEDAHEHVEIFANKDGPLFERVVGRVVFAMSDDTDHLMVARQPPKP